jgi:chemotaxis protein histidine kinase CheA
VRSSVGAIRPNPFRNSDRYPYRQDKIDALLESMKATGFWGNLVARRGPDGCPEIAYGHHRLEALRQAFPLDTEVELIERDLSDEDMIKMMARENMQEWGTSAAVEMETVRAVIGAYGSGRIRLPQPSPQTPGKLIRYAPSFAMPDVPQTSGEHPYTLQTVAAYIGWLRPDGTLKTKVSDVFGALELIEEGILSETDYEGLTTAQAQAVTQRARQVREEHRIRARQHEEAAAQAEREETMARARAEAAREAARQEEEQNQQIQNDLLARQAREASRQAQAEWEAADQARRASQQARQQAREQANVAREQSRTAASEAGRHVGDQIRSGASVREARSSRPEPPSAPQYPLDGPVRRTSQLLVKLFTESDVSVLMENVLRQPGSLSPDARAELDSALATAEERVHELREQLTSAMAGAL